MTANTALALRRAGNNNNKAIVDSRLRPFAGESSSHDRRQHAPKFGKDRYCGKYLQSDEYVICYIMHQVTTGAIANISTRISQLWYNICR